MLGEGKWTESQGLLYSSYLQFAKPFEGALDAIQNFHEMGFTVNIVSHKTKFPYVGGRINLLDKANEWIKSNLVNNTNHPLFEEKQIIFAESIKDKIFTILEIEAVIFIDDLKHVLDELPDHIEKVWFNPDKNSGDLISCRSWEDIRNRIWQMKSI